MTMFFAQRIVLGAGVLAVTWDSALYRSADPFRPRSVDLQYGRFMASNFDRVGRSGNKKFKRK